MVILPAQKLFIVIECIREMNFVAGRAKIGGLMEFFEKRLFMQSRFGFDKLLINPLQCGIITERERIMLRLFNREVGISSSAVDVGDRMTGRTGDPRLRGGVIDIIKLGIVKRTAEEWDRIMATGTESRTTNIAVSFE